MKKFISLLAASLIVVTSALPPTSVFAAGWEPFDYGNKTPHDLAVKVHASLARDPTGNSSVDPEQCTSTVRHGCATPQQYVDMFKIGEKNFVLDVAHLEEYLDTQLVEEDVPKGVAYWMAALVPKNGAYAALWNALSRTFKLDEKAWVDKTTHKIKLAQNCTNPVGEPDVPVKTVVIRPCDEIIFYLRPGDEVHFTRLASKHMEVSKCTALKKAGHEEWTNRLLDECPHCDFAGPSREVGLPVDGPIVSYSATAKDGAGWNILRLPPSVEANGNDNVFAFCIVRAHGRQTQATPIRARSFVNGVAFIAYKGMTASDEHSPEPDWVGLVHTWLFTDGGVE